MRLFHNLTKVGKRALFSDDPWTASIPRNSAIHDASLASCTPDRVDGNEDTGVIFSCCECQAMYKLGSDMPFLGMEHKGWLAETIGEAI